MPGTIKGAEMQLKQFARRQELFDEALRKLNDQKLDSSAFDRKIKDYNSPDMFNDMQRLMEDTTARIKDGVS